VPERAARSLRAEIAAAVARDAPSEYERSSASLLRALARRKRRAGGPYAVSWKNFGYPAPSPRPPTLRKPLEAALRVAIVAVF